MPFRDAVTTLSDDYQLMVENNNKSGLYRHKLQTYKPQNHLTQKQQNH